VATQTAATQTGQTAPVDSCAHALGDDLGWGLGVAFRAYIKAATAVMVSLPGGPRSYQLLTIASRDRPGTQLALAGLLDVDRTVMTYLLDALEGAGLVTREPDPTDRRARRIVVTKRGVALLADLDKQLRDVEANLLSALDDDERAAFRSLLQRIAAHVDALDPVDPCSLADSAAESVQVDRPARRGGRQVLTAT
jgi:DNA-binding MarR family transcriptional regulator